MSKSINCKSGWANLAFWPWSDPSGCGKSSLVHTGLLNALEAGFLAEVGLHWRIATMQPGSHPMRTLASALIEHIGPDTDRLKTGTDPDVCPPLPSGEGRGEGFLKSANLDHPQYTSTNSNPPSGSHVTTFSDTGASANAPPPNTTTPLFCWPPCVGGL